MRSFIERHIDWVRQHLGDPGLTKRRTIEAELSDLHAHHSQIFERLLKNNRNRSNFAYTEATITLTPDVNDYRFPGNFRRFIGLELRQDGDPRYVTDRLDHTQDWHKLRGILVNSAMSGFRLSPMTMLTEENDWTLCYDRGPIELHWGIAKAVEANRIQLDPATPVEQGNFVNWPKYYVGEDVHIFKASVGAGQSARVTDFNAVDGWCTLEETLSPIPSGEIQYEFRTMLPEGLDKVFSYAVALDLTGARVDPDRRRILKEGFMEAMASAKAYLQNISVESYRPRRSNMGAIANVDLMARQ